jgi:hypothetical protein
MAIRRTMRAQAGWTPAESLVCSVKISPMMRETLKRRRRVEYAYLIFWQRPLLLAMVIVFFVGMRREDKICELVLEGNCDAIIMLCVGHMRDI